MGKVLLGISLLFCFLEAYAQDYRTTLFQVEQGLPNPLTKAIYKDDLGFIWIGTDLGLVRFDGKSFVLYKDALPTVFIKSFFKRKNGDLLVVHDMGITRIVNQGYRVDFEPYLPGAKDITDSTVLFPKQLFEDEHDRLWIAELESIACYAKGKLKRYMLDPKTRTASYSRAYHFVKDEFATLWVVSQQGHILYFDELKDKFIEVQNEIYEMPSVSDVLKTRDNRIFIASSYGILEMEVNKKKELVDLREISPIHNVSCMVEDNYGNYFLGTWFKGLYKAVYVKGKLQEDLHEELSYKVINDLYYGKDNQLWVSSDQGIALLHSTFFKTVPYASERSYLMGVTQGNDQKIYVTDGGEVIEVSSSDFGYEARSVFTIGPYGTILYLIQHQNVFYLGTNKEVVYKLKEGQVETINTQIKGGIFYLYPDKEGNVWMCHNEAKEVTKITPDNQIFHYGKEKGIESNIIVIKESKEGELYMGGVGERSYLYQYDEETDRFINISVAFPSAVKNLSVDDLVIDGQGRFWLGTNNGLWLRQNDQLERVEEGLLKEFEVIKAIALGNHGEIWLGTDAGIVKYLKGEVFLFDDFNGIPSKTISHRSIIVDDQDRLWVGTSGGLGYTNEPGAEIKKTPMPVFLSILINNEQVLGGEHIFSDNSYLSASFASTIYPASKLKYRYRLSGIHKEWVELDSDTEIFIPKISHGNYVLEVSALQQGEYVWSDPARYTFQVQLAWYLCWYAWVLYIVTLVVLMTIVVKLNTKRLRKEKEQLEMVIRERTTEILEQKKEIETQRDHLIHLNEEIVIKKEEIESQRDNLILLNEEILQQKEEIESQRDKLIQLNEEINNKNENLEVNSRMLQKAFNEINAQKLELEKLNATKNKFFSIVAHDLKGPINSLSSFADLLANFAGVLSPEETQKIASDLSKAVKNTSNLTENLLTWARSQMENLTHTPENILLDHIIQENILLLTNAAKAKEITIVQQKVPDIEVVSDKDQLTFVLRNLISNAIKFTKAHGEIDIHVCQLDGMAEISIADNGVGMPEEMVKEIFDIGTKHTTLGTAGEKGTGLGLLLCKEFIEKNGGKIWVASKQGKGSTFTFSLRLSLQHKVKA
jgi:AraC family transcriptional regulator, chitin signaling transcriptional activator